MLSRLWPWIAAGAGIIALVAGVFAARWMHGGEPPELKSGTVFPADFRPIAEFRLTDHRGEVFSRAALKGQWTLMYFGFTQCPDVCPMTLERLGRVMPSLREIDTAHPLEVVFVSVDPARDTRDKLKGYVTYFDPGFLGVTGSFEQLDKLTGSLGAHYRVPANPPDPKHYNVDHSAGLFLIGPEARPAALLSAPHKAEAIKHDVRAVIRAY